MDDSESDSKGKTKLSLVRRAHIRWGLAPFSLRLLLAICAIFTTLYLSITLVDVLFRRPQVRNRVLLTPSHANRHYHNFTVVINTYQRPAQLRSAVSHYATTCGPAYGVDHVYIVWSEEGVDPPQFAASSSPVTVQPVRNSLNSRFLAIPGVTGAVFMVDDDIRVRCKSLQTAFTAWQAFPDSMVGFYPRLASSATGSSAVGDYVYHCWPIVYWRQRMNMILTKACFLHARFLHLYSNVQPAAIRDHVDEHFNCEDVAMSMLVANVTRYENSRPARPLYVEGSVRDRGLFNGISSGSGHMDERSECLNAMTRVYRDHGWPAPMEQTFTLREATWIRHIVGWQTRPSNVFEWFGLANVFK